MKKQFKRTLALLLALVMCVGLFAGCAPEEPNNNETNGGNTDIDLSTGVWKNSDIYPLQTDTKLSVFAGSFQGEGKDADKIWQRATGVDVEWIVWDVDTMNLALASKEIPDVFALHSRLNKAQVYEYGSAGMFIDYRDYLDYMPNVKAMFEKYPEALEMVINEDGSIYTLPQIGNVAGNANPIMIRTDMMKAAGWDEVPTTTDEFLQCIKDLQAKFGDDPEFQAFNAKLAGQMIWNSDKGGSCIMRHFFPAFGELLMTDVTVAPNGKDVVFGGNTEQYKRTLKYLNEIWESGAFGTDIYTEDGTVSRVLVNSNKVASGVAMETLTPDNFESGKIELEVVPGLTSAYNSESVVVPAWNIGWFNMMVSSKCADIETACRWIDAFYSTRENPLNESGSLWAMAFTKGELGVDWTINEEEKTFVYTDHEGYDSGTAWKAANLFYTTPGMYEFNYAEGGNTGTNAEVVGILERQAEYFVLPAYDLAVLNLTEDEQDIYNDYWSGIDAYMTEMTAKFITGELEVDAEWADFCAELDALGLQELLDMYQGAYDRALARK